MAYLQTDLLPLTAPAQPRPAVRPRIAAAAAQPGRSKWGTRFATGLLAAILFAIPGYLAAEATESLAIGILAADFSFLTIVAIWSSVVGGARR